MAKVIGISPANSIASTTAYDPTCGSGSLLLKVAAQTGKHVLSGNTLFDPKFKDGVQLRSYDCVVANPPFSDKTWSTGLTPAQDRFQRFTMVDRNFLGSNLLRFLAAARGSISVTHYGISHAVLTVCPVSYTARHSRNQTLS
jgi:type I restriction-modification system DNA methylase subunit